MGRWQRKILFSLVMYFAGVGTAIYFLAPAETRPPLAADAAAPEQICRAGLSGEDLARFKAAVCVGLEKFEVFAEEQTVRAAEFFKTRLAERQVEGG